LTTTPKSPQAAAPEKTPGDIRDLPKRFTRDGFVHIQIFNAHPIYVYRKMRQGYRDSFEVIKARRARRCVWNGKVFQARWQYPRSEQWGTYGFTFQTLERAMEKIREFSALAGSDRKEGA